MEVNIQDAERNLATLVESAAKGQEVVITHNGRPVARIEAVASDAAAPSDIVRRATLPSVEDILAQRTKLSPETIAELLAESRHDLP